MEKMERPDERENDDLGPPLLPLRRVCAKRGCRTTARSGGGRLCREHHAAAMRRWRARRRRDGAGVAGASPTAPSSALEAVRARMALSRARRHGTQKLYPCAVCNRREGVVAVHLDPAELETIAWACRGCRHELVRGLEERLAAAALEVAQRAQRDRNTAAFEEALSAIACLPTDVAATLHAEAARGRLGGLPLRPGSPLYQMGLASAFRRYQSARKVRATTQK